MNKETKKDMTIEVGLSDPECVVGFVQVKNFDGIKMHLNPKYLLESLSVLKAFDKKRDDVQIGISDTPTGGAFFLFLDKKCEIAIGTMGRVEE